jgi:hypothetical protein
VVFFNKHYLHYIGTCASEASVGPRNGGKLKGLFVKRLDPNDGWTLSILKIFSLKINLNILTFYIKSIIFQIKKSLQNKIFHFFIQNILTFFFLGKNIKWPLKLPLICKMAPQSFN